MLARTVPDLTNAYGSSSGADPFLNAADQLPMLPGDGSGPGAPPGWETGMGMCIQPDEKTLKTAVLLALSIAAQGKRFP